MLNKYKFDPNHVLVHICLWDYLQYAREIIKSNVENQKVTKRLVHFFLVSNNEYICKFWLSDYDLFYLNHYVKSVGQLIISICKQIAVIQMYVFERIKTS